MKHIHLVGIGLIGIIVLESIALIRGIDGTYYALAVGAVCTLLGFGAGKIDLRKIIRRK